MLDHGTLSQKFAHRSMELIINFDHPIRRGGSDGGGGYTAATDGLAGFVGGF